MLYHLSQYFVDSFGPLNLFRYLTFRTMAAVLTALTIGFLCGPAIIRWLKSKQIQGQPIREDGPEGHLLTKVGTPTMGGCLILLSLVSSTLLWADLTNAYIWIVILMTLGFGLIGAMDDYLKLIRHSSQGLSAKLRILGQVFIGVLAILGVQQLSPDAMATGVAIPFIKGYLLDLGWFFLPFALVVIVGSSNAVNLTDGLDGLAIGPVMLTAGCFCLISYLVGNHVFATYLQLHFVPHVGELSIFCGALVGAGLGFLWFNAPPAKIFMGDTGSLAVGSALAILSVITKHEIVLAIIGGVFVVKAISVILQVGSYKLTRRRIFLMAPIHHHFEKKGWSEPTIVIRFWIISTILALVGLSTLKLR